MLISNSNDSGHIDINVVFSVWAPCYHTGIYISSRLGSLPMISQCITCFPFHTQATFSSVICGVTTSSHTLKMFGNSNSNITSQQLNQPITEQTVSTLYVFSFKTQHVYIYCMSLLFAMVLDNNAGMIRILLHNILYIFKRSRCGWEIDKVTSTISMVVCLSQPVKLIHVCPDPYEDFEGI